VGFAGPLGRVARSLVNYVNLNLDYLVLFLVELTLPEPPKLSRYYLVIGI
jgi:hypothetical protein